MFKKSFKSFLSICALALLSGCIPTPEFNIPAYLVTENATIEEANGAWTLRGGSKVFIEPEQSSIIVTTENFDDWLDYGKILNLSGSKIRLGTPQGVTPHYDVTISVDGRKFYGKLLFNTIPKQAPAGVRRSFQIDLHAGNSPLPNYGDLAAVYGVYSPSNSDVRFASWMLWFSDQSLDQSL
jgi:hypothetical protein